MGINITKNQDNNKTIIFKVSFLLMIFFLFLVVFLNYKSSNASVILNKKVLVVFGSKDKEEINSVYKIVEDKNGRVSHMFEDEGFILDYNKELVSILNNNIVVENIHNEKVNILAKNNKDYLLMIDIWNKSFDQSVDLKEKDFEPVVDDALFPLDNLRKKDIGGPAESPYGANFYDIAEFMAGKVSVAIILPESKGGYDVSTEDWDAAREARVVSEIQSGMDWWYEQAKSRDIDLTFSYNTYFGREDARARTTYEPINRTSFTGTAHQGLWINQIMNNYGYNSDDYFYNT
ncbi:MAG: hypothetical protein HQ538_03140, partial [Parcubacteria group bacterium]|nr:hypothetical protein [Parcubacteria group bacterium]